MRNEKSPLRLAATAIALAAAFALPAAAQQADFTTFVQIGDSLTAGFTDGCLVEYAQNDSYGAILARHAGVSGFQQPTISQPGLGPCMYLTSLAPSFGFRPNTGQPTNLALARPYNNLGVPGYTVSQAVDSNPAPGASLGYIILRGQGTMLQQAAALQPTFVSIFIGNNDVLGAAGLGTVIDGVTLTPIVVFDSKFQTIMDTMKAAQGGTGKGIVMNIPDVTSIPFTTTVSPILGLNPATGAPIYALSDYACPTGVPACPVPAGSLLTLNAAALLQTGYGVPCAIKPNLPNCNQPLPNNCDLSGGAASCQAHPGVVLTPDEISQLRARTAAFNASIASKGAEAGYKLFDVSAFFTDVLAHGRTYGGLTVTTAYLQGGFFGYDGVHPTSLGYAIVTQNLIDFINANYGNSVDSIDMTPYLANGNTSPGGYPPPPTSLLGPATQNELIEWAAAIYSPENWESSLKYMFTLPARHAVAPGDPQDLPVRGSRGGTELRGGPQQ
jgi:lysophospholipase L1-like esterase